MQLINFKDFFIKTLLPLLIAFCIFLYLYTSYFFHESGKVGDDYSYFLPYMLSGYYWYLQNGIFAIPWFTPAFCGGLPLFANPQSVYFSFPQLLWVWFEPQLSIYITFVLFAAIGLCGSYYLLLKVFRLSWGSAFIGGVIFLFNGFYLSRMIMGHLTYHVFMLIPLISICLLYKHKTNNKLSTSVSGIILPALLFSYVIYAGAINMMVPILIGVVGVYFCLKYICPQQTDFWYRFFIAGFIALLLSAAKLVPAYFFISHFPRDLYSLPGFDGLFNAFFNVGRALFDSFNPSIADKLVNLSFQATNTGFDFSIGVLPIFILFLYCIYKLKCFLIEKQHVVNQKRLKGEIRYLYALVVVLLLPVLLNAYYPYWNDFLKQLPYIKNSSLLTRWIAIDILLLIIICCFLLDKLKEVKRYGAIITLVLFAMLIEKAVTVDKYDTALSYNIYTINQAYINAKESGNIPAVSNIGAYTDADNNYVMLHGRNDQMAAGISILNCYEPIFGYQLETFPAGMLRPGSILLTSDNYINLKNPACYVFGEVNQCLPGDHFMKDNSKQALSFSSYQSFDFNLPFSVTSAIYTTLISFVFCLILILLAAYKLLTDRNVEC